MTGSSPPEWLPLFAWMAVPLAGCAAAAPAGPASVATTARAAPDDGDLWNLAPAAAESIAEVDVAALGRSPWSRSLVTGGFAEDREQRMRWFGYDVFTEVDRLLVAGVGGTASLTVARGRFDADKIAAAFTAGAPGARATRWRDSPLWEGAGRAIALVTPRTIAQGTPEEVRAAIDAAWAVVPDARGGPLGELRRALDADRPGPAVTLALVVTDELRARAAGFVELPPGLRRLGARLDLGHDLDLEAQAVLADARAATEAAGSWSAALRELRRQRMLRVLGLAPLIEGATLRAAGARVTGHLHVGEEQLPALSERLLFLLQTLAGARSSPPPPP